MEEFLLALLSGLAELLVEVLFEVALESIIALIARSARTVFAESNPFRPILAGAGYALFGAAVGAASVGIHPRPLFHPSRFHGVSLLVSPVVTGLVMSQVGSMLRRHGKRTVRIESFAYGFMFALGWAVIRFIFAR